MAAKVEKEKEKVEVITAVYKVNLHCPQCAREIKKPLLRIEGVHSVEVDMEKSEIKAKGSFDVVKMQKRIEKLSQKKVDLISPIIKPKEKEVVEKKVKETKQLVSRTISVKVHMHCSKCEQDLKKKLLKHKGIHGVKTDMKAQILTVEGTIEPDKLVSYLRKKVNKRAEIIPSKSDAVAPVSKSEKIEEKKEKVVAKKIEIKDETKKGKEIGLSSESSSTKIVEASKEEVKIVEVKTKEANAPYFIHYVYAPQLFSDENPNACYIM